MASLLLLPVALLTSVQALFTVEVGNVTYVAEFSGDVLLECRFAPVDSEINVSVVWHRMLPKPILGVYRLQNGWEDLDFQNPHYRGRVQLLKQELKHGRSLLRVSDLRINDTGTYQCLVEMVGADYKQTDLTVKATYKSVKKGIHITGKGEMELSCEAEGYPLASIIWMEGNGRAVEKSSVTNVTSSNLLHHITSKVYVKASSSNYTCTVTVENIVGPSASFNIGEEVPELGSGKPHLGLMWLAVFVVTVVLVVVFLLSCRKKGLKKFQRSGIKTHLIQDNVDAAYPLRESDNGVPPAVEEDDGQVKSVRNALVNRYLGLSAEAEVMRLKAFCDNELPRRLHDRQGVCAQIGSIVPGAGETVLLEGSPASGKTSVALSLAFSWAQDFDWDPFGVRKLPVLMLVTCGGEMGDLFDEAASQLGPESCVSEESLRALLTGPADSLLVIDGYRDGGRELDGSLATFLRDRQACRVLITAQPSDCAMLAENCGTVLQLHHLAS